MANTSTRNMAFGKSAVAQVVANARAGKMSQLALAEEVGVSRTVICHLEQGRALPGEETMRNVAKALRIKQSDLAAAVEEDRASKSLAARRRREDATPRGPKAEKAKKPKAEKPKKAEKKVKAKKPLPKATAKKKPLPKKAEKKKAKVAAEPKAKKVIQAKKVIPAKKPLPEQEPEKAPDPVPAADPGVPPTA